MLRIDLTPQKYLKFTKKINQNNFEENITIYTNKQIVLAHD